VFFLLFAPEYSDALNREVTYSDIPPEDWERELKRAGLPEHLTRHLVIMAGGRPRNLTTRLTTTMMSVGT
jgi:hypothetical protein